MLNLGRQPTITIQRLSLMKKLKTVEALPLLKKVVSTKLVISLGLNN